MLRLFRLIIHRCREAKEFLKEPIKEPRDSSSPQSPAEDANRCVCVCVCVCVYAVIFVFVCACVCSHLGDYSSTFLHADDTNVVPKNQTLAFSASRLHCLVAHRKQL